MHEISVLQKAVDMVEQVAVDNNVKRISYIQLEVGELTGYLPVFFEKYYDICTMNRPIFEGSEVHIKVVKGQALCSDCEAFYNVMANKGVCPVCGSRNKQILGGQTFKVKDFGVAEMDEPDYNSLQEYAN